MSTADTHSHDPADLRRRLEKVRAKSNATDERLDTLLTSIESDVRYLRKPVWQRIFNRKK